MIFVDHFRTLIRDKPFLSANNIYTETAEILSTAYRYSESHLRHFPSFPSCKSIIYRIKREFYPSSHRDLLSSLDLSRFLLPDGGNILLFHEVEDNPMIILGNPRFISNFCSLSNVKMYMDGTFKASPNDFY